MKKLIIICNHFAPDNMIAAVRTTKFAKCFKKNGYEVIVIAEKKKDMIEDDILKKDAEGIQVIRVANSKRAEKILKRCKKIVAPLKEKKYDSLDNRVRINPKTGNKEFYPFETAYPFLGSLDYLMELYRQYDLARQARKEIKTIKDADVLFSSYGDYFSIFASIYFRRLNKEIPWIFDIRDAIYNYKFTPEYVIWIAKWFENYLWKNADAITAVSKGICRRVSKKYWHKVYCVTNGYDKNDRQGIDYQSSNKKKMKFAYTGAMYGGIQNLAPVFKNIKKILKEEKVDGNNIEFCFAGKESAYEIFKSQAEKYDLQNNCIYHGKLARKESLKLQMEADILLVSTFDYQANIRGIITGKALEYMSANKPIVAIINGDIEHSELADIIRKGNLGCAYEEAHDETDNDKLYQYLLSKYEEYKINGQVSHNPNKSVLQKYDYDYLGKKMLQIINNTCKGEKL